MPSIISQGAPCNIKISFTVPNKTALNKVLRAERALHDLGVEFSTGDGENARHWFFDNSLDGPAAVSFLGRK